MIDHKIVSIAKDVRKKSLKFAMSKKSECFDFHGKETLECMCAFASFGLYKELLKNGFNVIFCEGCFTDICCCVGHCWVEIDDNIIDITATQFGISDIIYVTGVSDKRYTKYKNVDDINKIGWDFSQAPDYKYIEPVYS